MMPYAALPQSSDWPDEAPWQRQPGETMPAWTAFFQYLMVESGKRTVTEAYRTQSGDRDGKAPSKWWRWAERFDWDVRAVAFDRWNRERYVRSEEAKAAEENERWAKVRDEARAQFLSSGKALMEKAAAMLNFPLAEVERATEMYPDGRPREVQVFKPARWNMTTVARFLEVGSRLIQMSAQVDTDQKRLDLHVIWSEADIVARETGTTREEVLALAEQYAAEAWGKDPE